MGTRRWRYDGVYEDHRGAAIAELRRDRWEPYTSAGVTHHSDRPFEVLDGITGFIDEVTPPGRPRNCHSSEVRDCDVSSRQPRT